MLGQFGFNQEIPLIFLPKAAHQVRRIQHDAAGRAEKVGVLFVVVGVLRAHPVSGQEQRRGLQGLVLLVEHRTQPMEPIVVHGLDSAVLDRVGLAVDPVGGEQHHLGAFLNGKVGQLELSGGEVLGVDIHADPDDALEGVSLVVGEHQGLEAVSFRAPELVVEEEVGLADVELQLAHPVDHGGRVVESGLAVLLLLFDIAEQHVAVEALGLGGGELELFALACSYSHGQGVVGVLEVVAGEAHLREDDDVEVVLLLVELQGRLGPLEVLLLLLEEGLELAEQGIEGLLVFGLHD